MPYGEIFLLLYSTCAIANNAPVQCSSQPGSTHLLSQSGLNLDHISEEPLLSLRAMPPKPKAKAAKRKAQAAQPPPDEDEGEEVSFLTSQVPLPGRGGLVL